MEKRVLIASLLIFLVLLGYPHYMKYVMERIAPVPTQESDGLAPAAVPAASSAPSPASAPSAPPELPPEATVSLQSIETQFVLSNLGGGVKATHLIRLAKNGDQRLFLIYESNDYSTYLFSMSSDQFQLEGFESFQAVQQTADHVVWQYERPGDLRLLKTFRLADDRQHVNVTLRIDNLTQQERSGDIALVAATGFLLETTEDERFVQSVVRGEAQITKHSAPQIAKQRGWTTPDSVRWHVLRNKYFCQAVQPEDGWRLQLTASSPRDIQGRLQTKITLSPGGHYETTMRLYVGRDDYNRLKHLGLAEAKPLGFLGWIGQLLLELLNLFHRVTQNYGAAIILLTILVSTALYPLTHKSLSSMKKMQELQPKLQQLQAAHKGNPKKLNTEMMELYRKYKVNPLGGCLPLVLQMPVFIALYNVLLHSVELKGSSFLWIQDLSRPDAAFKLSVSLPFLGNLVNILPFVMTASMFFQQRLSTMQVQAVTPEQRDQQRIMGVIMPIMFCFLFYNMPSGLVLYWLTNTCIMITIQLWMLRS